MIETERLDTRERVEPAAAMLIFVGTPSKLTICGGRAAAHAESERTVRADSTRDATRRLDSG